METSETIQEFSLLGGPLQKLGCRLGLARSGGNTVRMGLALGLTVWVILLLLALVEGFGKKLLSLPFIGMHVRFLVSIPLMFLSETLVIPQMTEFTRYVVRSGLVPAGSVGELESAIRGICRKKDSRLAEVLALLAAFALPLMGMIWRLPGNSANWAPVLQSSEGNHPLTVSWYLGFCLPLFRFLLFRWLWRLGLWWYFLWRLEKLDLHLVSTHSDGTGGLGYLEVVHQSFLPLMLAISAACSAHFAEEISSGTMAFADLSAWVPMVMLLNVALFIAPMLMFSNKLWHCRVAGMSTYMGMASRYVDAFEKKWIGDGGATGNSQLGTADIQSLADLTNSVNVVREMRWIPAGQKQMMELAVVVITPLAPLLLMKYPLDEMAGKALRALAGL